jgi:benzoyl-CoA reductase subunit C
MDAKLKARLESAWRDPAASVGALKQKSAAKAVGLALTDVPHELVHAAGALPMSILGRDVPFLNADRRIQGFACAYSRTLIELSENGALDFLDGIIIPYACDVTRCLDLIFKHSNKFTFTDCVRLPKRTTADGAPEYFRGELARVGAALAKLTGIEPTDARLTASIAAYNNVRALLAKLRAALRVGARGLTASEYMSAVRAAMVVPPEASTPLLEQAVADIGPEEHPANGRPKVIIAGKMAEPPELFDLIEAAGLRIVEDHLVVGGRWILATVPENLPPLEALVQRQLGLLPFAGIWDHRPSRADYLLSRVKETNSAAAIFLVQKNCEPAELDLPGIKQQAAAAKVPILSLETDFSAASLSPIKTRIEAFAEMLKG